MSYYIYLIKATRKPVFLDEENDSNSAIKKAEYIAKIYQTMFSKELAVSGISVQIVDAVYAKEINKLILGSPKDKNIPVIYQINGY